MHYRMLFGFYGGMALIAYLVGYAFGVFDNSPSWLGVPEARDCGLGVIVCAFSGVFDAAAIQADRFYGKIFMWS